MARNLLRLYDRGAVEMPTILYTPNMDYKKYLILHSRSNYDADAPKARCRPRDDLYEQQLYAGAVCQQRYGESGVLLLVVLLHHLGACERSNAEIDDRLFRAEPCEDI